MDILKNKQYYLQSFFAVLFIVTAFYSFSQDSNQDYRLAINYYNNADFQKAVLYFEKLASSKSKKDIYNPYRISLIETNNLKEAEKLVKKQLKKYPNKYHFLIDLGKIYELYNKKEKAQGYYVQALKKINQQSTHQQIQNLATAYEKEGMIDFALQVYELGNKYNSNKLIYNQKIAAIYNRKGETQQMIKTYLELIDQSNGYLAVVQRNLSSSIDLLNDSKNRLILKNELLRKSQKQPNNIVYNELLAWYFSSVNDFNSAYIQIKSIDKKTNAQGAKLLEFAQSCYVNESYEVALKCYQDIITKFPQKQIAAKAKAKKLKTLKAKLVSGVNITREQLILLKENYTRAIDEIKTYFNSYESDKRYIDAVRGLADLEAYYLHDYSSAEYHLQRLLRSPGISKPLKGEIKIELAEVLVLKGELWDASLLFMQVEKQFKEDRIGHLAKFKNAKVYYYTGEYDWCQAQLDVLKASTSKLIANDAMDLSLLITDNYNLDTSTITMDLFAQADLCILQHNYLEAESLYDSINSINGYHTLNDDVLLKKANIAIKQENFEKAILLLTELIADYGDDILADNALFLLGNIYEHHLYDLDKAKEAYKTILFNHKGSLFVVEARKRYRKLSGSKPEKINTDT
ncbi:MAG: hypothetical protein CL853_10115 [Crocinitomicaceae bacterium]|nr:hypothetical protein [Crocinitomicaceae bacterium]|tara:strand:+ start:9733 stop:11625 length:1893 start_codon:yes stop_codon:yes gene_type:complete